MREAQKGEKNSCYGRHHTEEEKRRIGESGKGRKAWNVGLTAETDERVKRSAESKEGKHPSLLTREIMVEAQKKRFEDPEERRKNSIAMQGKNAGRENGMYGMSGEKSPRWKRKHTQVSKKKMRGKRPCIEGEKNPNYIDGKSCEPYTFEFNSQLKELIRLRDGYKCQKCGCPEIENKEKLSIHHIDYNKKNCLPTNLITLCLRCNSQVNTNRRKWKAFFKRRIKRPQKDYQLCLPR